MLKNKIKEKKGKKVIIKEVIGYMKKKRKIRR
jgi:hypothetical protein